MKDKYIEEKLKEFEQKLFNVDIIEKYRTIKNSYIDKDKFIIDVEKFIIETIKQTRLDTIKEIEGKKKTTDDCYLEYDDDGYLTCLFNHKKGDDCLMNSLNKLKE